MGGGSLRWRPVATGCRRKDSVAGGEKALERKAGKFRRRESGGAGDARESVRPVVGVGLISRSAHDSPVESQGRQRDETSPQGIGRSKPSRG